MFMFGMTTKEYKISKNQLSKLSGKMLPHHPETGTKDATI